METPEVEAHTHHRTGIGWLDASLALSAFAVSIISLFVAIHHGSTMKEMAEANAKMVQASVWPFVELSHSNNSNGTPIISMDVANQAGYWPGTYREIPGRLPRQANEIDIRAFECVLFYSAG